MSRARNRRAVPRAWGRVVGLLSLALLVGAPLSAQDSPPGRRGGGPRRRDEVFRMVDAYLAMNVEEALGLSAEQSAKVLPLVRRLQVDRRRFMEQRFDTIRELKRRLESGAATEPQIASLMNDLHGIEREEPLALARDREAIDQALTLVQQAQYRVLEAEIEHRIRELAGRHRGPRD